MSHRIGDGGLLRYGLALIASLSALAGTLLTEQLISSRAPLLLFLVAVLIGAWFGGLGPGLFALGAAIVAAVVFVLPPRYALAVAAIDDSAWLLLFVLCGAITVALTDARHRALRRMRLAVEERERAEAARLAIERQALEAQRLESLGTLAGGVAHDFNNLLGVILGNTQLALEEPELDAEVRHSLEVIALASRHAGELTAQILLFAGRAHTHIKPVDLNELIRDMQPLLTAAHGRAASLRYQLAPQLPLVAADLGQMRQVLLNLVINVAEALGDSPGTITVATNQRVVDRTELMTAPLGVALAERRYVLVEVADTGRGMDEATKAQIFDPFFSTKFLGRGLGLASALGIVRAHEGTVLVRSALGKGSTFTVLLPPEDAHAASGRPTAQSWVGQGVVLIITSDSTTRIVSRQMLERMGFTTLAVADLEAAVQVFEQTEAIVCAVLDTLALAQQAVEMLNELRRRQPVLPAVVLNSYNAQDLGKLHDDPSVHVLRKPFSFEQLRESMQRALETR